ncbi:phosphotransferase [Nonomuraea sp. NPDC050310]|uniref:phosphotransferase n=1 Tax=Nonomuraea sp. NPDC050310 TaxID=3154935 RepID=UPI0033E23435
MITRLGEGWDNVAYDFGGELIVRLSKAPDPDLTRREVALLAAVAAHATLPVPEVVFADESTGLIVYRKLHGEPLSAPEPGIAAELGEFLTALHRAPVTGQPVPRVATPLAELRDRAAAEFREVAAELPAAACRTIERFLARPVPADSALLAFCHNDLAQEHVLVSEGRVSGVIDWSDAAIADPARDFALLYRDVGPDFVARMPYHNPTDAGWVERVPFYARCALVGDLAYGVRTGTAHYVAEALGTLDRTVGP